MKRLIRVLAELYPRWWRARYGDEFDALIEDAPAHLRTASNVLTGALVMQVRTVIEGEPLVAGQMGTVGLLLQNWWLLACTGVVQAAIAAVYLEMQASYGPLSLHTWHRTVTLLGCLELTAGLTVGAAGLIKSKDHKSWLLVLNAFALTALGLIHNFLLRYPIRFTTIAALVLLMAFSIGMLSCRIAHGFRTLDPSARRRATTITGMSSTIFAGVFLGLVLRWIPIGPGSHMDLFWLGFYFAFSAICMLGFALQVHARAVRNAWAISRMMQ